MMNSGNFEPDSFKSRFKRSNRNKNKNKQNERKKEETVGTVIEPAHTNSTEEELDPTEDVPDSDNAESIKDDLEVSSQEDDSSDDNDIDTDMERVFVMINSGFNEETDMFHPEAEEEKYYADCNDTFNDNKIVGCVTAEPT